MGKPVERIAEMRKAAQQRLAAKMAKAKVRITVGSATCENAAGADAVYAKFKELVGQHADKSIVLDRVGCAGKCDMEPLVTISVNGQTPTKYVFMDPDRSARVFESHVLKGQMVVEQTMQKMTGTEVFERVVTLCAGASCTNPDRQTVQKAFVDAIEKHGLKTKVQVVDAVCANHCGRSKHVDSHPCGPVAFVYPEGISYAKLTPETVEKIVTEHFRDGKIVKELVWASDWIANRFFPVFGDISYFSKQLRMTLRNCGVIDPENMDDYLNVRGYEAVAKVLQGLKPEEVVSTIKKSGLRGRGGGGFPTGLKWEIGAKYKADQKYIVCNADEGDPGAFMDRSTIEGDPHTIIEGMIIGGYAIGATKGFVYIRAEYPLAIKRIELAIDQARKAGMLGKNIMDSGFDFDVEIRLGAGAFVCGEETALIASIEGKRGMPRPRPPFPAESGLWGKPTIINNVETFANIPVIILDGAEWFASVGTEKSKGTKVFALAGDIANTGLIEVPMGTTLREVVYGVGGGIKDGKRFKAVQTGGPAGGCLPATMLDTPIDYDTLMAAGSIMGSGGMIVMCEDSCMVNVARFFLDFTQDESCGKCTPCREGTKRLLEILTRLTEGQGQEGDVEKLQRLAETVKKTSLCGLGQASPNPVLSTIKHFRAEYDEHIRAKSCSTGACKNLVKYTVITEKCVGCGACKRNCPVECISGDVRKPHVIDQERCIRCGRCFEVCKFNAVLRK